MHDKISYSQFSAIWMAGWPGEGTSTRRKRALRSRRGWFRWHPLLPACCSSMVGIAHSSIQAAPAPRFKHAVRITSKQHTQSTPRHSLCSSCFSGAVYLCSFSQCPSSTLALILFPLLFLSWRSTPPAVFQLGKRERMKEWVREVEKEGGDPRVPGKLFQEKEERQTKTERR